MTHILPAHGDPDIVPHTSISSIEMEQGQQQGSASPPPSATSITREPDPVSSSSMNRKRKKANGEGDDGPATSEPRRLRRSHEACARCRSKKIKCDSKHPKCSACVTAGVQCNQEDRHRKTLTPRGHVEKLERQILQCQALLRLRYPNFNLQDLDNILAREGLEVDPSPNEYSETFQFTPADSPLRSHPHRQDHPHPHSPPRPYYPPHIIPGYPPMSLPPGYAPSPGHPYPVPLHGHIFPPHVPPPYHPHIIPQTLRPETDIKGQDPQMLDMSNTKALAKNFGVAPHIVNDLKFNAPLPGLERLENEDLAVRSGGLSSGRTRELFETIPPRDTTNWISVVMQHVSFEPNAPVHNVTIWLPKDRVMAKRIVDVYFTRLDVHRPTFNRRDFEITLDKLYENQSVTHDPGYVCSLYLVLALGTMCDLNGLPDASGNPLNHKKLQSSASGWPEHVEFFERALATKPDLRVTLSSLQALILLHWYLYTERQGRSLWRLVGNLVRLAIELGLHHDPTTQTQTFSEDECKLRIRLWATIMIHDRGTSILLGRPLGISPPDSNTPRPTRTKNAQGYDFSEHFLLSAPVADIQADIVNSLYSPTRQGQEAILRSATRIIKSMVEFRKQLPEPYKYYFGGTENWTMDERITLVKGITEDQGLTLLKIGIARILLLRALFSSSELTYQHRRRALADAIVASHNVIVVHNHLIQYPDIAFFVSPIPIHIGAMVILYGQMSKDTRLSRETAIQDIWTALDLLPRFRWRWERKDMNGGHPMIEMLAEKVLSINLSEVPSAGPSVLIPEEDWETSSPPGGLSPASSGMQLASPTHTQSSFNHMPYGPIGPNDGNGLANVPSSLFWPMDPHTPLEPIRTPHAVYYQPQPIGIIGCQPSQTAFVLEEKDPKMTKAVVEPTVMDAMAIWPGFRDANESHAPPAGSSHRE